MARALGAEQAACDRQGQEMTDFIELAKGKLNDPILMEWALDRYRDAQMGVPQRRQAMEKAWFDDLTLRRWLDSDDQDVLTRLFSLLPAERFGGTDHLPQ